MNEKEFMTTDDLCIYLNIGRSTAYKLIKNGTIPAKKISSKWIISRKQIKHMLLTKTD